MISRVWEKRGNRQTDTPTNFRINRLLCGEGEEREGERAVSRVWTRGGEGGDDRINRFGAPPRLVGEFSSDSTKKMQQFLAVNM